MKVLIAEDVKRLADDIAEGLRDQGMAVDVAYDGTDATFKLDGSVFTLTLTARPRRTSALMTTFIVSGAPHSVTNVP